MDFEIARARLIDRLTLEIGDKRVLSAMSRVPRHLFVPTELVHAAYDDEPLPIGLNQTISQPYIVALMTEKLELTGDEKVLELGTGSGYQTAILAELATRVVTTERLPELMEKAKTVLQHLGYKNIEMHLAEKALGWKYDAPYDAIISTAGAPRVPDDLIAQLAIEGRMMIPVGSRYSQELYKIIRHKNNNEIIKLGGCRFVSLIGKNAWEDDHEN
jgi:protein-L-isoaspartate(D-aspartate) O-methyltransferase